MNKFSNVFRFRSRRVGLSKCLEVTTETGSELFPCRCVDTETRRVIAEIRSLTGDNYRQYPLSDGSTILINMRRGK